MKREWLFFVAGVAVWSGIIQAITPAPPRSRTRPPCVAYSFLPNIEGYEPHVIKSTIVFMDGPVFDRVFAGCDDPENAILASTPDILVRVFRKEYR